jgi:hypothetical protein
MTTKVLTILAGLVSLQAGCVSSRPDWVVLATGDALREIPVLCQGLQAQGVDVTPGPTSLTSAHILVDASGFAKAKAVADAIVRKENMSVAVRRSLTGNTYTLFKKGHVAGTQAITTFKSLEDGQGRNAVRNGAEHSPAN